MDYKLTEEEQMIKEVARTVAQEKIKPQEKKWTGRASFLPKYVRKSDGPT